MSPESLLARARTVDASDTHRDISDLSDQSPPAPGLMSQMSLMSQPVCVACGRGHSVEATCRAKRDAWWSLVKEPGGPRAGHAYRWARTRLALDDEPETAPARQAPAGHAHGWAPVEGEWRCLQGYYAAGERPDTGCGATWEAVR
ncbi:hypothetical protein BH23CHL8_BH23CHL8_31470 [soil metagenome]